MRAGGASRAGRGTSPRSDKTPAFPRLKWVCFCIAKVPGSSPLRHPEQSERSPRSDCACACSSRKKKPLRVDPSFRQPPLRMTKEQTAPRQSSTSSRCCLKWVCFAISTLSTFTPHRLGPFRKLSRLLRQGFAVGSFMQSHSLRLSFPKRQKRLFGASIIIAGLAPTFADNLSAGSITDVEATEPPPGRRPGGVSPR